MSIAMTTTKPATQVYSRRRKARAPSWIASMSSTMRALPGSAFFTTPKK